MHLSIYIYHTVDNVILRLEPPRTTGTMHSLLETYDLKSPIRRKGVPRAGKRIRDLPTPTVSCPTKHQTNSHSIYAEDLVQTHAGSVFYSYWVALSSLEM